MKDKLTITISKEAVSKIKEYCDKNNLKIGGFCEKILIDYINK